jgi:hypothetical protein
MGKSVIDKADNASFNSCQPDLYPVKLCNY